MDKRGFTQSGEGGSEIGKQRGRHRRRDSKVRHVERVLDQIEVETESRELQHKYGRRRRKKDVEVMKEIHECDHKDRDKCIETNVEGSRETREGYSLYGACHNLVSKAEKMKTD